VGAAVARRFAKEGRPVLVAGRTATKIEQVVRTVGSAGGIAEAVLTDATVCWASRRSPRLTGRSIANRARPGPQRWICGPIRSRSRAQVGVLFFEPECARGRSVPDSTDLGA